ncbi:MAG: hypothetical protein F6J98_45285 [Moorea sp. SIO4G2]|nr:hypothetical protein [Moorena sp. SIO4G2]
MRLAVGHATRTLSRNFCYINAIAFSVAYGQSRSGSKGASLLSTLKGMTRHR